MLRQICQRFRKFMNAPVLEKLNTPFHEKKVDIGTQILLSIKYKEMASHKTPLPNFDEIGFSEFSASNEDGILLYIFSLLGTANKKLVDIGAAGVENSNVANLLINHGWIGLLIDANSELIEKARLIYKNMPETRRYPPVTISEIITAENINLILQDNGFTGEIDLLSIDIDGNDYWVWKSITCLTPRVVIVEYQDIIGPELSLTIPYDPCFDRYKYSVNLGSTINYCGASLPAFVRLGREKGYKLVGCTRYGINAFFVRDDLGKEFLPEVAIESCFKHPRNKLGHEKRWPLVQEMEWQKV